MTKDEETKLIDGMVRSYAENSTKGTSRHSIVSLLLLSRLKI